ncbi:MAG TPA: hypothetical protein VM184_12180 [Gaiellaceae bacterium]|nr:hypothetical protein [Gaiellaceae bacterium]
MTELERRLQDLGGEIAYPATPRFDLGFDLRPARAARLRPLALAFAILLAALAGLLAFSPSARSAFLEIFRLQGATVERVETLPEVEVQRLDFGEEVSRAEAERRVGFELLDFGEPDGVYVRDGRIASLVYGDPERPRLVLSQLRGGVYDGFVKKAGGAGTFVEEVRVGGERGLFVSGDEHFVMFLDEHGEIADERTYLAGTVLLWNRGDLLLRLEGDLTRDEALELAHDVG